MCDHNHGHGSGCCHDGDADVNEANSLGYSLYNKINFTNLQCLNEYPDGSGKKVFKAWDQRLSLPDEYVQSDTDCELIFNIPFTGDVKLHGIIVIANERLGKMRIYKSKMPMSFDDMGAEPDQEFEITHDPKGVIEYPLKPTKFSNVHHLTIHLRNWGDIEDDSEPCQIFYIGLKGEFTQVNRDGIVIANYEIRPTEGIPEQLRTNTRQIQ